MSAIPEPEAQPEPTSEPLSLDNGDAARQVAHVTGMTPEAAQAFASYHSGRFAHGSAFRRAA